MKFPIRVFRQVTSKSQRHKEIAIGKVRDGLKKLKFILYEEGPKILRVKWMIPKIGIIKKIESESDPRSNELYL